MKQKKHYNRIVSFPKRFLAVILATLLIFGSIGYDHSKVQVYADDAVGALDHLPGIPFSSIDPSLVPNGMFLIGSYLIYDQYMCDTLYTLAQESMSTYNQQIMYYKSALAGGHWIDVAGSTGLTDLSGKTGETVDESELRDYKISVIVYADGTIASVSNAGQVYEVKSIFNQSDPYNILGLTELTPLRLMYTSFTGDDIDWDDSMTDTLEDSDSWNSNQLYEKIWTARLLADSPLSGDSQGSQAMKYIGSCRNDTTNTMDQAVSNLSGAYAYYQNVGNREYLRTILEATEQADATRRAEVYYLLAFNGAGTAYNTIATKDYDRLLSKEEWAEKYMAANWGSDWRTNDKWTAAIDTCITNHSSDSAYSSVDYNAVGDSVYQTYKDLGYTVDYEGVAGILGGANIFGNESMRSQLFSVDDTTLTNEQSAVVQLWLKSDCELRKVLSYSNKISSEKYYTMSYLARDYAWALNYAGDRLADVKYWNEQGDTQKAYSIYTALVQRAEQTQSGQGEIKLSLNNYVVADSGRLNALLQRLESGDDLSGNLKQDYTMDAEYAEALKTSIQNCEESYYKYNNRLVGTDTTLLGRLKYETMQYLITNTGSGISGNTVNGGYNQKVVEYTTLRSISNDIICEKNNELALLNSSLLPQSERMYVQALSNSPCAQYLQAVENKESADVQQNYLMEQKQELNGILSEYEFLIAARVKRLPLGERIAYIDDRIDSAEGYRTGIQAGAFNVKANTSVDELIDWLRDLKKDALSGSSGDLMLDSLESQKAAYEEAYLSAMDEGDIDAANGYKELLDDVNAKIANLREEAAKLLGSDGTTGTDALDQMEGSPQALADEVKQSAMDDIDEGNYERMTDYLSALGELGATDTLNDLEKVLKDANASNAILNSLQDAKKVAQTNSLLSADASADGTDGEGTGSDVDTFDGMEDLLIDTSGFGSLDDATYDSLNAAITSVFGDSFANLNVDEQAAAATGISTYAQDSKDKTAKRFAMLLFNELLKNKNPFVYQQYLATDHYQYVNLSVVDRCRTYTGYRYVYKSGMDTMAEIKTAKDYLFAVGYNTVITRDGTKKELRDKLESQTDVTIDRFEIVTYPYLRMEDAEEYMEIGCYYIPETTYSVLLTPKMDERVKEMTDELKK